MVKFSFVIRGNIDAGSLDLSSFPSEDQPEVIRQYLRECMEGAYIGEPTAKIRSIQVKRSPKQKNSG